MWLFHWSTTSDWGQEQWLGSDRSSCSLRDSGQPEGEGGREKEGGGSEGESEWRNGWRGKYTRWYEKDDCREDSEEGENMRVVKWWLPII